MDARIIPQSKFDGVTPQETSVPRTVVVDRV